MCLMCVLPSNTFCCFPLSHFSMNDEFDSDDEQEKGAGTLLIVVMIDWSIDSLDKKTHNG